jgi:hypothetical protein
MVVKVAAFGHGAQECRQPRGIAAHRLEARARGGFALRESDIRKHICKHQRGGENSSEH